MFLEERNPAPQCHKDGCCSSAIQSGTFKTVNRREHFSILATDIKIRKSSAISCELKFGAVAQNVAY